MIKWSWRKSRRSTWLSQRYTMNQVSTLSSLAGLLFIAGIKNVKISRATLSFASHLFSLPLVKINVRHIKESMRRLLVRHLKPEIFWVYRIGDAAWLRTCTISQCKSFVLKTFFPCADFQRIWRLSSWSAFDLCRTSEAPSQPLGKDVRLYPLMPSWSYLYFNLVLCALLI